jgi:hypothetical protein
MASTDQTVRVFIGSTFRDRNAERDHLVTVVFPELRERVERLELEFIDVDLRWGMPDEAEAEAKVLPSASSKSSTAGRTACYRGRESFAPLRCAARILQS